MTSRKPLLPPAPAPYFDPETLGRELDALAEQHAGDTPGQRKAVLNRLKKLLFDARQHAESGLNEDGNGRRCAAGLSRFMDELIRLIYDYTLRHVYPSGNLSTSQRIAIVATGGYGRGLLAPSSDIDLLFLLPYKQTSWGESLVEFMLYILWDLRLKVGHAVRTVEQCVRSSESDMTIRTALLDARLVLGSTELFGELTSRLRKDVFSRNARAFIEAKLAERDARHVRSGESRYQLEPNIKDGKGGLRDLHLLHWLSMHLYGTAPGEEGAEFFSPAEARTYRRCEDFLWTIRCLLHVLAGRAEERLSFEMQPLLAERLGYTEGRSLRTVERFMKHYFLIAKDVGDLTRIVAAALEVKQLKSAPVASLQEAALNWRARIRVRRRTDFRIDNGRLNVAGPAVFERDPVNLIRLFAVAESSNAPFHPDALRLVRQSVRLIDERLRRDPEANRIFLGMLTARTGVEPVLRNMNETGVLGRFVPEFGRIVAMMQFNMYHHYTVDEHLIRSVGILNEIEEGRLKEDHPLATRIMRDLSNRRALYVAQFLHDVGKGRKEDHSVLGAEISRRVCPRLGLSEAETETVAWLIENHLVMSTFAQSRDLTDPKTIEDFALAVQSPERLRLLLILTVADIRAVGPGVWNGWKGQLLRTLYYQTEPILAGGHTKDGQPDRIRAAEAALGAELPGWSAEEIARYAARHHPAYWLKTTPKQQAEHARLVKRAEAAGQSVAFDVRTDAFTAVTELTVLAPNVPRLLAMLAGACAASGANILTAQISTTRDGLAIDTFLLKRELSEEDELRRATRIGGTIEKLVAGAVPLEALMERRPRPEPRLSAFSVAPQAEISNLLSERFTVVEVAGLDRPGLLYELTSALSDLRLDINSAHVTTFGERAVDVFYVTDLQGRKLTSEARIEAVRDRLHSVLAGPATRPTTAGAPVGSAT